MVATRLLLVDDDSGVLDVQKRILERESYEVDISQSGSKALRMLKRKNYDLVITDLVMPEFDGIELIISLQRSAASPKVVATSGGVRGGSVSCLKAAKLCGATRTIKKPFSRRELLDTVQDALQS